MDVRQKCAIFLSNLKCFMRQQIVLYDMLCTSLLTFQVSSIHNIIQFIIKYVVVRHITFFIIFFVCFSSPCFPLFLLFMIMLCFVFHNAFHVFAFEHAYYGFISTSMHNRHDIKYANSKR